MGKKIPLSVLMSVYFKETPNNLKMAIESIIEQTYLPDEFIIVKDGILTEELDSLLSEYNNNYEWIKIIQLEKNVGLGRALNQGLIHCKNEYVARMDSDDYSFPYRFEQQIEFISKHPDCDAVGGNIIEFDNDSGEDISLRRVPIASNEIKRYLKKRNPMNHVSVIFKKDSVLNCGGYIDCPYFEDYYLWARMLKSKKKLMNINTEMVRVRAGLSMSNRRGNIKYIKCIINFEKKLLNLGLITHFDYFMNILIRVTVAILPNNLRYKFYQWRLRNEKN